MARPIASQKTCVHAKKLCQIKEEQKMVRNPVYYMNEDCILNIVLSVITCQCSKQTLILELSVHMGEID